MRALLTAGVAVTLCVACSGERAREVMMLDTEPVPLERLAHELAWARCMLITRCSFTDDRSDVDRAQLGSLEQCTETLSRVYSADGAYADLIAMVSEGRARYDAATARACVNRIATTCGWGCPRVETIDLCADAFEGTIPEGEACYRSEECAAGTYCSVTSGCPGACMPRLPLGSPCTEDFQCAGAEGVRAFCGEGVSGPVCVALTVLPDADVGEECGARPDGIRGCREGLYCDGDRWRTGVCVPPVEPGGFCEEGYACSIGHVCADRACRAITVHSEAGAACDDASLQLCSFILALECVDGACTTMFGDGTAGSACHPDHPHCEEGLRCHIETGTCEIPKPAGAACWQGEECESGACDSSASVCAARYCRAS